MDKHYQGLFIADTKGILFTGILESGKEYKGSDISKRAYFNQAKDSGKTVISEVVKSKSTGKMIVVACAPIHSANKEFQGVVGVVIKAEFFTNLISGRKIGETGYGYMINKQGIIIAHPKSDFLLKLDVTTIDPMKTINTRMMAGESGVERYTFKDLAGQTSKASNEIKERIDNIQSSTGGTVEQISSISKIVTEINDIVSTIATAVEEQSVTTQEISQNMSQASLGIQEVNENINQSSAVALEITQDITDVNQSSTDMADRSEQVKVSASELSNLAEKLNALVGQFKI